MTTALTSADPTIVSYENVLTKLRESQTPKRASLFNLVIYTKHDFLSDYFQAIVQEITTQFPCRLIYVQHSSDPNHEGVCIRLLTEGSNKVTSEEVHIKSSQSHLNRIPFLIFPLLLRDLPVYLLWEPDPSVEHDVLPLLIPYASRLIYDANATDNLTQFCKRISRLKNSHPKCEFNDINWTLLMGWQHILRQVFDSPTSSEQLRNNNGIEIYFNSCKSDQMHPESQATYLLEWLANSLNWEILPIPKKNDTFQFSCKTDSHSFVAQFTPKNCANLYPGTIVGLNIMTNDSKKEYSIEPIPNQTKVAVHISSQETCELPFSLPLANLKPGFPYVKELFFSPISNQYEEVIKVIGNV